MSGRRSGFVEPLQIEVSVVNIQHTQYLPTLSCFPAAYPNALNTALSQQQFKGPEIDSLFLNSPDTKHSTSHSRTYHHHVEEKARRAAGYLRVARGQESQNDADRVRRESTPAQDNKSESTSTASKKKPRTKRPNFLTIPLEIRQLILFYALEPDEDTEAFVENYIQLHIGVQVNEMGGDVSYMAEEGYHDSMDKRAEILCRAYLQLKAAIVQPLKEAKHIFARDEDVTEAIVES